MSSPRFAIANDSRIVVIGPSNSGKSTLLRAMTVGYRRQVVIDSKHEETLPRSITVYTPAAFGQTFPHRAGRVVFRPDPDKRDGADVDEVMHRILAYGRTAIVVHDGALYATSSSIVPAYRRAQLIGRSLGVPVWSGLQRPTGVHNVLLSEASDVFLFDLALESDRTKVAGIVGPGALQPVGTRFAFSYYGPSTAGVLIRCDPLEVPRGTTDALQPGARHDHGDGRDLRRQMADPDGQRPGARRARRRDLTRPA